MLNDWPVDDGGIPPDLKSIRTSPEKINAFVEALLGHHRNIDIRMKKFLTANGIRFFNQFMDVLQREPKGKFADEHDMIANHKFVNEVSFNI